MFLRSIRRLMLIGIYMKFLEDSVNGFQVIERTRFFDRQTPDGKTIYLPRGEIYRIVEINTVDTRYLEFQGTVWNTSRYPYFDISAL